MMEIPPGLSYLCRISPFLLFPSAAVFGLLQFNSLCSGPTVPSWLSTLGVLLARPLLSIFQRYYQRYVDERAAAAKNALVIPHVREDRPNFAGLSLIAAMVKDMEDGCVGDLYDSWREQYGNIYQLRLLADNRVFTFEPDHVKAILATQFEDFEKGPLFYEQLQSLLGTGVFNSDGDMWKFHRTITRPFFNRERITDFDIFDAHADHALRLAKARLAEGHAIDFQDLVSRFTLDTASEFLFGKNVDSLSAGIPYSASSGVKDSSHFRNHLSNTFVYAFSEGQTLASRRLRYGPSWPAMEFFKDNVRPHRKVVDEYIEPILLKALRDHLMEKPQEGDEVTLLSHLVHQTQDIKILKDEIVNLLVAGRDTTASTLTFSLYMLSEHPEVAARLRQEVLDKVGPSNRPMPDDVREMKYLRAFINEVLRLYPPVPFDVRETKKATLLTSKSLGSKPYYVLRNTSVFYSVLYMQRRTDLWGPDALEFDPDRFLDERVHKYLTPNPYIFTPFNAGPRICLGQQFAYHETSFFLIRLLQLFANFRLAPDAQPRESKPPPVWGASTSAGGGGRKAKEKVFPYIHLTMSVKGGLWARMDGIKE